jgi:hypothetical protein
MAPKSATSNQCLGGCTIGLALAALGVVIIIRVQCAGGLL